MCKNKDKQLKNRCKNSRERLEKSIEENDKKLCKMIGLLLSGKCPNLTPVDGNGTN